MGNLNAKFHNLNMVITKSTKNELVVKGLEKVSKWFINRVST